MTRGPTEIASRIHAHYVETARELPWRKDRNPYAIWISEIMCQQTRIETVIPFFESWMRRFPTLAALASAPLDDVLAAWSGLGYYSRARNIHRCAQELERTGGQFPTSARELRALPGIGRYTAGAIASQAFDRPEAVVDGNVARVLARLFGLELDVKSSAGQKELWRLAESLVPDVRPGDFNQGLMELGQSICKPRQPECESCPLRSDCVAMKTGRQSELPILPARKKRAEKIVLHQTAAFVRKRASILVAKRPAAGLYGGLWELPSAGSRDELLACLRGLSVDDTPSLRHEQELSHRLLRIDVFEGTLARKPRSATGYLELIWQPLAALADLGVSSATQSIIASIK